MSDDELKRVQAVADALYAAYQNGVNEGLAFGGTERERLRAKLAELKARAERAEEALRPFAAALDGVYVNEVQTRPVWETGAGMEITFGDLRRARAVLAQSEKETGRD